MQKSAEVPESASGFSEKLLEVRRLLVDLNAAIGVLSQQHELEVRRSARSAESTEAQRSARSAEPTATQRRPRSAEPTEVRRIVRSAEPVEVVEHIVRPAQTAEPGPEFAHVLSDDRSCVSSGETALVGETAIIPPRIFRSFIDTDRSASKERASSKERYVDSRSSSKGSKGRTASKDSSSVVLGHRGSFEVVDIATDALVTDADPQPPKEEPPETGSLPPAPEGGEPAPGRTAHQTRSAWKDEAVGKKASITALTELPLELPSQATGYLSEASGNNGINGTQSASCSPANRLMQARLRALQADAELPGTNPDGAKSDDDDDDDELQREQESFIRHTKSDGAALKFGGVMSEVDTCAKSVENSHNIDDWGAGPAMDHVFTSPMPAMMNRLGDGLTSARSTINKKVSVVGPKEEVAMRIIRSSKNATASRSSDRSRGSTGRGSIPERNGSLVVPRSGRWSAQSDGSATPVLTLQTWKARASGGGTIGFDSDKAEKMHFAMHPHTKNLWRRAINRSKFLAKMRITGRATTNAHESEGKQTEPEDEDPVYFWMSDIWKEKKSIRRTMTSMSNVLNPVFLPGMEPEENGHLPQLRLARWYDRLMINPNSPGRIMWDMMGCILFFYDAVFIPLEFFQFRRTLFLSIMTWIIRLYWTFDIPLSFFTGKELAVGTIEKDFWKIAKSYSTSWLPIDFILVFIEWLEIVGESRQEFGIARLGKMARNLRMLRMFRFLKIIKTVNLPEELKGLAYIRSEKLMIVFGIMKIMIAIVWVNHFLACFWYGLGAAERDDCWVASHGYRDADIGYVYLTSFHWALTQFTGNMEILAWNAGERFFSIIVLLLAFVISAFAVSSITTSMTRLQIVTAAQSKQFSDLRKYLAANNISKQLAMRINKSANSAVAHQQKNMPEDSVDLLRMVSEPLRIELHYEVNAPCLTCHPFFNAYDAKCRASMRQVCHQSVAKLALHRGDLVFSSGEMPEDPVMFFIVEGKLLYLHNDTTPANVENGQWAAEAVLWTLWVYHGTMRAKGDCSLLILDAQKFQKIACQFLAKDGANPIPYGREFVKHLNNTKRADLTDLEDLKMELQELVKQVFGNTSRRPSFAMGPMWGSAGSEEDLGVTHRQSRMSRASGVSAAY